MTFRRLWTFPTHLCALCAALILTTPAYAQDSTSPTSRVVVVTPLSFVKDKDLNFGDILPGNSRGFVTLAPDGTVTTSGGVQLVTGSPQGATFWGYGTFLQRVRINLDRNAYTLTRQGGPETMRMDRITIGSRPPTTLSTRPRTFLIGNPDGYFTFGIGGRLRVGANQAPGTYQATFTVTLEYQ